MPPINHQKTVLWTVAIGTGIVFCGSMILNWWKQAFDAKSEMSGFSVMIQNPPSNFQLFDVTSQKILAIGCLIFLSCWGVSKVLKVWK